MTTDFCFWFISLRFYYIYTSTMSNIQSEKFQLKSNHNPVLDRLLSKLQHIQVAETKVLIEPFPMEDLLKPFVSDYFMYYGSIATTVPTPISWIITRKVIAISPEQVDIRKSDKTFHSKLFSHFSCDCFTSSGNRMK